MAGNEGSQSAEEAIIATRKGKADRIRRRGENPFANDTRATVSGAVTLTVSRARALAGLSRAV